MARTIKEVQYLLTSGMRTDISHVRQFATYVVEDGDMSKNVTWEVEGLDESLPVSGYWQALVAAIHSREGIV